MPELPDDERNQVRHDSFLNFEDVAGFEGSVELSREIKFGRGAAPYIGEVRLGGDLGGIWVDADHVRGTVVLGYLVLTVCLNTLRVLTGKSEILGNDSYLPLLWRYIGHTSCKHCNGVSDIVRLATLWNGLSAG